MKKILYAVIFSIKLLSISNILSDCFLPVPGNPFPAGAGPNVLTFSPDGKFLAVTNYNTTTISVYNFADNGTLTPVPNSPFESGFNPAILVYSPDGKFLAAANANLQTTDPLNVNNTFSIFSVNNNGSLTQISQSPILAKGFRFGVTYSKDGKYLLVNGAGLTPSNPMYIYKVNTDGSVTEIANSPAIIPNCDGPEFILFSKDGQYVYCNCSFNPSIIGYKIAKDGSLSLLPTSPFKNKGTFSLGMEISANGKFLATANYDTNNADVFQINSDGSLTSVPGSPFASGGTGVDTVAFSPNNRQAALGNSISNDITFFDFNPITGAFSNPRTMPLLSSELAPATIRYSPNGLFVAIAEFNSNNVSVYRVAITAIITISRNGCFGPFTFKADSPDGTGPLTFEWTGPNGFTANTQEITVSDGGPYTVKITDSNGCTGFATKSVQSPIAQAIREKYCPVE